MLRIYKDNDMKLVTKGAYNQMFKPLGYKIVLDNTKEVKKTSIVIESKNDDESNETVVEPKRSSSNKRNKKVD